jgi:hypothetical protein
MVYIFRSTGLRVRVLHAGYNRRDLESLRELG